MSKDGKTALWVLAGVMFFSGMLNVALSGALIVARRENAVLSDVLKDNVEQRGRIWDEFQKYKSDEWKRRLGK